METRRRLRHLGYPHALVDAVVDRLAEMNYLDDAAFARAWVESRDRARPRGEAAFRRELMLKGLGRQVIDDVLAERTHELGRAGSKRRRRGSASGTAPLRARPRNRPGQSAVRRRTRCSPATASTPKLHAKPRLPSRSIEMRTEQFSRLLLVAYLVGLAVLVFLPSGRPMELGDRLNLEPFADDRPRHRSRASRGRLPSDARQYRGLRSTRDPVAARVSIKGTRRRRSAGCRRRFPRRLKSANWSISLNLGYAYRSTDIDDVILNVTGAFVGYAAVAVTQAFRGSTTQPIIGSCRPRRSRSQPAGPDDLVRQEAGNYLSGDERFEIRQSDSAWYVVDRQQTNEFGQELMHGPFGSMKAAKSAMPGARDIKPLLRSVKRPAKAQPPKEPPKPPPSWIDKLSRRGSLDRQEADPSP